MKFTRKKQINMYLLILIGLFVFCQSLRWTISEKYLYPINYVYIVAIILLFLVNKRYLDKKNIALIVTLIIYSSLLNIANGINEITEIIRQVSYLYLPLLLFCVNYDKQKDLDYFYIVTKCLKFFNTITYIIFFVFLLNFPTNGAVVKLLYPTLFTSVANWLPDSYIPFTYRYASYLGHYIYTADIFCAYFGLNKYYGMKTGKYMNKGWIIYLVSVMGVLSTASKSALVVLVTMIIILTFKDKKRRYGLLILLFLFVTAYSLGVFDFVISRFYSDGKLNISTSRGDYWTMAFATGQLHVRLLSGFGATLTDYLSKFIGLYSASILNEYPFLAYIYMYGLLNLATYIYLLLIKPVVIKGFKKKEFPLIVIGTGMFAALNTYNSILVGPDYLILYVFVVMIATFISKIEEKL